MEKKNKIWRGKIKVTVAQCHLYKAITSSCAVVYAELCRMLSQPEHLVVGFKHASWHRMQGLGGQGGAAMRVNYKKGVTKKEAGIILLLPAKLF